MIEGNTEVTEIWSGMLFRNLSRFLRWVAIRASDSLSQVSYIQPPSPTYWWPVLKKAEPVALDLQQLFLTSVTHGDGNILELLLYRQLDRPVNREHLVDEPAANQRRPSLLLKRPEEAPRCRRQRLHSRHLRLDRDDQLRHGAASL
eukprot:6180838-Pleurochrysis_carterae.AAC.4